MTIGLVYSLVYGLAAWGMDTWVLARSHAELACAKLLFGLPLVLTIGAEAGGPATRSGRPGAWVTAWVAGGVLTGAIVGLLPYVGMTAATWMVEPRLLGTNVYPIGSAGTRRLAFVAVFNGCVGSVVGLTGYLLVEQAGGRASPDEGTDRRPWALLLLCLVLAVLPGLIGDEIANRPLRAGQWAVHSAITTRPIDTTGQDEIARYRDLASDDCTLHRVGYDLEILEAQTIDAAFEDSIVVRCQVSDEALAGCRPISSEFETWMDALIQGGLQGRSGTALAPYAGRLSVSEDTERWLASQRGAMAERYEISRDAQRGGWVIMSARFDTGFVLSCYFYGTSPVVVDHCSAG